MFDRRLLTLKSLAGLRKNQRRRLQQIISPQTKVGFVGQRAVEDTGCGLQYQQDEEGVSQHTVTSTNFTLRPQSLCDALKGQRRHMAVHPKTLLKSLRYLSGTLQQQYKTTQAYRKDASSCNL